MLILENIKVEKQGSIAILTLTRPQVLNVLNRALLTELAQAIEDLASDAAIRLVLLTGAGTRAFAAGADIHEVAALDQAAGLEYAKWGQGILRRIETLGKPVIAVIFGFALGGGCELAMACTLRLASEDARFGQPEVKLGVIAGFGGTQRLPRLVGRGMALKLLLSGEVISSAEAFRIGLVDEIVPSDRLMDRAIALGKAIAANAPIAIRNTLAAVDTGLDLKLDDALAEEASLFAQCCATQDKVEGMTAFLTKRPAEFKGE